MKRLEDNGRGVYGEILGAGRRVSPLEGDATRYDIRQHRGVIVGCSLAGITAIVTLTVCLYRCRQRSHQSPDVDPELGDGPSSERGRLIAVQAPPPVPDLCPYSPQTGELATVGQSPSEQYAADCRAIRAEGTGAPRSFGVGGPGRNRCAMQEGEIDGGNGGENSQASTRWDDEPGNSKSHDAKRLTSADSDDDDDDVKVMRMGEMNNNFSCNDNSNNNNNNNNNDDDGGEDEPAVDDSQEAVLTTSTTSTESSGSNANESEDSKPGSVLELSLAYDTKHSTLVVSVVAIHQFQALVTSDDYGPGSTASPYVRLQVVLRDGRRLKAKTRVVRTAAGAEPALFGETFAFRDLSAGLPGTRLHAAVLGFDRFSRDAVLGEVTVPLDDNRLLSTLVDRRGVLETFELNIVPKTTPQSSLAKMGRQQSVTSGRSGAGELLVSIGHQPGAVDKLTVVVLKARNLPSNSDTTNGCTGYYLRDVYVKVYMLYKGRRVNRKQTRAVACGIVAPSVAVFNEAFLFDVDRRQSLVDIAVELILVDCHRVTRDEYLGRLVVSPFDGDRPADTAGVRGPLGWVGGAEHPAISGTDRPVAVWHRLVA